MLMVCPSFNRTIEYPIQYPFNFKNIELRIETNCSNRENQIKQIFPIDFSSSAQFFVTTGVLSALYSIGSLTFYLISYQHYENNPLIPVIDLAITGILSLFWFAGSSAWATNVSDLKHYTNPLTWMKYIVICKSAFCETSKQANWSTLNVSLVSTMVISFCI